MTDHNSDSHPHRTLNVPDVPLDAANQSLADALRASFNVLKAIMFVLVVLFLFSGLRCVQQDQGAVVLHFGRLDLVAREPGASWAWPYPIDETLRLKTTAVPLRLDDVHWFRLREGEDTLDPSQIRRYGGLDPGVDGYLVTGDRGIAHVKWSLVYRIENLPQFVANVSDSSGEETTALLRTLVENAAVGVAGEMSAAQVTQQQTDKLAGEVKRRVNEALSNLETGIVVTTLEIPAAIVPQQTRDAFVRVIQAENLKTAEINDAQQEASKTLNRAAGAAHAELIEQLDRLDRAQSLNDTQESALAEAEIDRILMEQAGGIAGAAIRQAKAFYTQAVQGIRGDVEQYEALVREYERDPRLLIERLWQDTERRILASEGVTKFYLPPEQKEIRIPIGPDPRDKRKAEEREYARDALQQMGQTAEIGSRELGFDAAEAK